MAVQLPIDPVDPQPQAGRREAPPALLKALANQTVPLDLPREAWERATTLDEALSLDPQRGWVPPWFPEEDEEGPLTENERKAAFLRLLEESLPEALPPNAAPSTIKRSAALSLLHLYSSLRNGALPTRLR